MMAKEAKFTIYTDGSAVNGISNIAGGFCAVVVKNNKVQHVFEGSEMGINSMQSELLAVILGLYEFTEQYPEEKKIILKTDSKIIADCFNAGWYRHWKEKKWMLVKNKTYWQLILNLMKCLELDVTFKWIRGHNGNRFNEMADKIALRARKLKEDNFKQLV